MIQNRALRRVVKVDEIERFAQVEVKGEARLRSNPFRANAERRIGVRAVVTAGGRAALLENRLRAAGKAFERGDREFFRPTFDFGDFRVERRRLRGVGGSGDGGVRRGHLSGGGAPFLYLTQFLQFGGDDAAFAVGKGFGELRFEERDRLRRELAAVRPIGEADRFADVFETRSALFERENVVATSADELNVELRNGDGAAVEQLDRQRVASVANDADVNDVQAR